MLPDDEVVRLIARLQARLDNQAETKVKAWWERYLKGQARFRGVKTAAIRSELHDWLTAEALAERLSADGQKALALALIRQPDTEDKLAGMLYLQEVLIPDGLVDWPRDLPRMAALFDDGFLADWNSCDWFCVRVLGPLAQREGPACARAIAAWRTADTLWQRRAAGVAFVNLAGDGEANFPGFVEMLLDVCAATVRDPARFAQTGTGWVLRELAQAEPQRVMAFIEDNLAHFSSEGLRYATEKMATETKLRLRQAHRAARRYQAC
ncbi:MAG: DNA alkylation repair protein [Candidatus Promineifilaceae bacterium]|nr:DNA alkylation repair protein [Candidatus Promineifilaceae bacterium]